MYRFLVIVVLASVSGCAHLGGAPLPPRDFSVTLRETGGIAGRDAGIRVGPDGSVRSWGQGVRSAAGVLPEAARETLWSDLRAHFRLTDVSGNASVVRSIEVRARGTTQRARWAPGAEPDLDALYQSLRETSERNAWPSLDG